MSVSPYLQRVLFEATFGGALYVALFDGAPDGTGAEIQGNGYRRQPMDFIRDERGAAVNVGDVLFPPATPGEWGGVTHFALYDAPERGNLYVFGPLGARKVIEDGDQAVFRAGTLSVEFGG